ATALLHAATEAVRCCIYTPPAWVRRHLARSRHPGEGALTSEIGGSARPRRADCLVQPVHHDLSHQGIRPLWPGLREQELRVRVPSIRACGAGNLASIPCGTENPRSEVMPA